MSDVFNNLKILHVATMAEVLVHFKLPLLEALTEAGAMQSIYCSDEQYCKSREDSYKKGGHMRILLDLGYNVKAGPITRKVSFSTITEMFSLYRHIQNGKFDIVIAHQPIAALLAIPASTLARTPLRIYFTGGLKDVTLADKLINRYGEYMIIRLAGATMLINHEDYEKLSKHSRVSHKVHFVSANEGCGVDTRIFNPENRLAARPSVRKALGIGEDETVFGYVGRCVWEKGFREWIVASSQLRRTLNGHKLRYLVIGTGPKIDAIRKMVHDYDLADNFVFTGYRHDIEKYYSAFDIFMLPSYREGLPTSLLQAMAMGLPCIATNIRGSRELVEDMQSGLLVEPRDSDELAEAMFQIVSNTDLAKRIGKRAAEISAERYSRAVLLPRTMDILKDIIRERFEVK